MGLSSVSGFESRPGQTVKTTIGIRAAPISPVALTLEARVEFLIYAPPTMYDSEHPSQC